MYAKLLISQTFFNIYFIEVHINQHLKGLVHIVDFIFVPARNTPVFINGHDDIITIPRFIRTKDAGDIIIVYALDKLIIGRSKFVYPVIAYFVMNRCRSALRPVDNYPPESMSIIMRHLPLSLNGIDGASASSCLPLILPSSQYRTPASIARNRISTSCNVEIIAFIFVVLIYARRVESNYLM